MKLAFTSITYRNPIKLVADEKGYYEMIGGAIGLENESGELYIANDKVLSLFGEDSRLGMFLRRGYLKGEVNHPEPPLELESSDKEIALAAKKKYFQRLAYLDPNNTCLIIGGLRLEPKMKGNQKYYEIWLKVKPFGPKKEIFEEAIKEDTNNPALSIRTISKMYIKGGKIVKEILAVFTWDHVPAPGINIANKVSSKTGAALETLTLGEIDLDELRNQEDLDKCLDGICPANEGGDMMREVIINAIKEDKTLNINW